MMVARHSGGLNLLRLVPGRSPVHRLWAGTKVIALGVMALTLSVAPTWSATVLMAALVIAGIAIARIPAGARPRLPQWFWVIIGIGGALALLAGGEPIVHVGSTSIGLGGLSEWGRAVLIALTIVTAAMLVSWTTPLADVAPALRTLATPLRWLRLPVDEWVVAAALALRCLPLLLDEFQTMLAARRLRAQPAHGTNRRHRATGSLRAVLVTMLLVSIRRAHEMGQAMEARGGWQATTRGSARVGKRDVVALLIVGASALAAIVLLR
jgi:energy-coupling factor transporter transmembrane protein EcfT